MRLQYSIFNIRQSNLTDHLALVHLGGEAARTLDELGCKAGSCNHGRLFCDHGKDIVTTVDQEIRSEAKRQVKSRQDIFCQLICNRKGKSLCSFKICASSQVKRPSFSKASMRSVGESFAKPGNRAIIFLLSDKCVGVLDLCQRKSLMRSRLKHLIATRI